MVRGGGDSNYEKKQGNDKKKLYFTLNLEKRLLILSIRFYYQLKI